VWTTRTLSHAPWRIFTGLYRGNRPNSPFWHGVVAQPATPADLFDQNTVYERGAMTLQALRMTIGTKDFFRLVHRWTARLGGENATTARFEAMAENVSGENLDVLFGDWLHSSGRPPLP
jgi:aminopeptidase N